ncbi:MAG: DegV family protein [Oscillospiraceae bacterium]
MQLQNQHTERTHTMPYMLSCDSTTDLTLAQYAALDLHYVSLHFLLDGKEYPDDYGQSLPMKTFFDAMAAGATTGTSQVTTGEFELYFRQFLEQGSDILHVSLSSGLSGCYHSACAARTCCWRNSRSGKSSLSTCGSGGAAIRCSRSASAMRAGPWRRPPPGSKRAGSMCTTGSSRRSWHILCAAAGSALRRAGSARSCVCAL